MSHSNPGDDHDRWARLRFAVVGPLLASPPPRGWLRAELERLSQRDWEHPSGRGPVRFSASTIERWYYQARAAHQDPVKALRRRARADAGRVRAMSPVLVAALREQYRAHPSWSAQLHYDNLQARVDTDPALGPMPSYATVTRVMRSLGLVRQRRRRRFDPEPERAPVETREVLSYEVSRSHALWHADFHHGKRRVLTAAGEWRTPILLGFLDDHSRLGCHLQWYLAETAETFVHGLSQALMKRGVPLPFAPFGLSRNCTLWPGTTRISVENRSPSSPGFDQRRVWSFPSAWTRRPFFAWRSSMSMRPSWKVTMRCHSVRSTFSPVLRFR